MTITVTGRGMHSVGTAHAATTAATDAAAVVAAHARICLRESTLAALADRWPGDSGGIRTGIVPDSHGSQP